MKNLFKLFLVITLSLTVSACSNQSEEYETYVRGEWHENIYTNDFVGLTFTYPEGFTLLTDEELINMFEIEIENSKSDEQKDNFEEAKDNFEEAMELARMFFDFALMNYNTDENVMLIVEDLEKTNSIDISTDDFMDLFIKGLISFANYSYEVGEKYDAVIAGETYRVVDVTFEEMAIQKVYIRKKSKYMIVLSMLEVIGLENGTAKTFEELKNN